MMCPSSGAVSTSPSLEGNSSYYACIAWSWILQESVCNGDIPSHGGHEPRDYTGTLGPERLQIELAGFSAAPEQISA